MRKRSTLPRIFAGATAVVALGLAGAASAQSSPATPFADEAAAAGLTAEQATDLQAQIDRKLAATEGAQQTGFSEISWPEGVTYTFGLPGQVKQAGSPNCGEGSFCMYQHEDYEPPSGAGGTISFWKCGSYDLAKYDFKDKASSLHNNQTKGTWAWAGSWNGSGWDHVYRGQAKYASPSLGAGSDTADRVWLCKP